MVYLLNRGKASRPLNIDTRTILATALIHWGYSLLASYTYDAGTNGVGRRTGMTDPSGSTSWTYDGRGRVTQESKTISGGGTYNTSYTYDDLNRVKTTTYPDGEVVNSTYSVQGLSQSLAGASTYVSAAGYNAAGQPTALTLGNTVKTSYLYDAQRMRLLHTQVGTGGSLLDMSYSYDPVGNITRLTDRRTFTLSDPFDTKSANWTWNSYQTVVSDGGNNVIKNSGTGSNYDANFYRSAYSLSDGKGMRVRFKVDQTDTSAHFSIEANDATNRRFGMIANGGRLYVQYANNGSN